LPGRINGSVVYRANPNLRLEAMGGWVNWGVYKEFTLRISDVGTLNTLQHEDTAGLLNKKRVQARDAHNTFWTALDVKAQPFEAFGFGGRITFDQSAIPTASLSPNNFDANTLILGGFVSAKPNKRYTLVLGFSQYLAASRVVSDSLFGVTLDRANRNEERYFYPQANGTYSSSISRLSLALRGTIGPLR
jgi:long-subunit fatty acid transport protein